ncbi:anaerobic ribonucleoside-triphosphate reductase activating protein [Candidatus Absconditicoccus praedator]|uniref:anaerobic ribonucleoside-triphosphate reductase activating protein n=1 Tax=Candidatus Absconditicoccus praedator TaxID=2735562 RepID=UPI001E4C072B|nr:anaerobic ribonucleoside-triphosphate reductase activating protein [Candidatus Absconditicoccus praedator]UFX82731.1 anaerobic ribonucleoside-triphosphate reductase activating protein [Candidatus Absconditicoccus praedator]
MNISGITKTTLLDYPGKVACTVFTPGCNLRCRFCHNPDFVVPEKIKEISSDFIYEESFLVFLDERKFFLDGVVICGGEPTLQPDISDFAKKIKDKGFLVKLDTNGTNFEVLKHLIDNGLVDYVAMDIKTSQKNLDQLLGVQNFDYSGYYKSIQFLKENKVDYEFRTTLIKGYHTLETINELVSEINGAKRYVIKSYTPGKTLDEKFDGVAFKEEELDEIKQNIKDNFQECYYVS